MATKKQREDHTTHQSFRGWTPEARRARVRDTPGVNMPDAARRLGREYGLATMSTP
jgi:hypothetical protein